MATVTFDHVTKKYGDVTAVDDLSLEIHGLSGFSFYDCLIVAAAYTGGCKVLYTEDMHSGYKYRGLTIVNPFTERR